VAFLSKRAMVAASMLLSLLRSLWYHFCMLCSFKLILEKAVLGKNRPFIFSKSFVLESLRVGNYGSRLAKDSNV